MTSIHILKTIAETVAVLLLIYGFTKEDRIAALEREQVRKVIRWFRKTRICREINRMFRAYEMAHQEVRR